MVTLGQQLGSNNVMSLLGIQPGMPHLNNRAFVVGASNTGPPRGAIEVDQTGLRALVHRLIQDVESRKKREKSLLQEQSKLEKERDSWSGMCSNAIATMKGLEAELKGEKLKQDKVRTEMVARIAQLHSQTEQELQAQRLLLKQTNDEVSVLRTRVMEMEKVKKDYEVKEQHQRENTTTIDTIKRELDVKANAIHSLLSSIFENVTTLATSVKAFQGAICGTEEKSLTVGIHGEKNMISNAPVFQHEPLSSGERQQKKNIPNQEKAYDLSDLMLVSGNLSKEIVSAQLSMSHVAEGWKQTIHLNAQAVSVVTKELKMADGVKFQRVDICGETIPLLDIKVKEIEDEVLRCSTKEWKVKKLALYGNGSCEEVPRKSPKDVVPHRVSPMRICDAVQSIFPRSVKRKVPPSVNLVSHKIAGRYKGAPTRKKSKSLEICGSCGQLGHMRMNRICPLYMEDGTPVAWKN